MADGTEVGTAYVSILPSAAGFGAKLQSQITGEAESVGGVAGKALGKGITTSVSGVAKGIGGIFAAVGAAHFFKGAISEAQEAVKVGALTNAVIKSTGAVAGVTADQVEALADKLSKVAGIDDELIQAGENVLLTFTSIRNQVGAGNDIFDQATATALDMSVALGTDLQGSIIQLGKALNDPIQGMTALSRVGVSFTEQQKDQVKALQQSGDLLGAQKIVLGELSREFGGAAAAGATGLDRLHVAVGNFQEALGTALLPTVNAAAGGLTSMLGVFTSLPGPIQTVSTSLFGLGAAGLAIGVLIPKIQSARTELEGMGRAGTAASRGIGLLGKAGLALAVAGGLLAGLKAVHDKAAELVGDGVGSIPKLTEAVADFLLTGKAVGELGKQFETGLAGVGKSLKLLSDDQGAFKWVDRVIDPSFSAARDDIDSLDKTLAGMVSSGHKDAAAKFFEEITRQAAAQGVSVKDVTSRFNDYGDAVAGATAETKLAGLDIQGVGADMDAAAPKVRDYAKEWADLHDQLEGVVLSDFSKDLASNLTSALNPLEKFAVGSGATLATIRGNLTSNLNLLTGWLGNLTKLSTGGHESLAKHLAALGPEAAGAVAEAVGVSPRQLEKIEGLFDKADKTISDAASGAFELNLEQAGKPGETLAQIVADRYEKTLLPKFEQATLAALDIATANLLGAESGAHLPFDVPGEIGPGEAHQPPAAYPVGTVSPVGTKTVNVTMNSAEMDPVLVGKAIAWEI